MEYAQRAAELTEGFGKIPEGLNPYSNGICSKRDHVIATKAGQYRS